MSFKFQVHRPDTAPEASRPLLDGLQRELGMIPNLAASMAESPELLRGFLDIREVFYGGTFDAGEIQVLALTNAYENGCRYCMALHSRLAANAGVEKPVIAALRRGQTPRDDARLAALSDFSRALVRKRGHVSEADVDAFAAAGFTKAQALEVVLGVAVSVLPNFAHQLTDGPIDDAFRSTLWAPAEEVAGV